MFNNFRKIKQSFNSFLALLDSLAQSGLESFKVVKSGEIKQTNLHEWLLGLGINFGDGYFHLILVDFLDDFLELGQFVDCAIVEGLADAIAENNLVNSFASNDTFLDLNFAISQILLRLLRLTLFGRDFELFDQLLEFFGEGIGGVDLWRIHERWWTISALAGSFIITWVGVILLTSRCCDRVLVEERILGVGEDALLLAEDGRCSTRRSISK